MPADIDPITGQWYQPLDKGQEFQVVMVDETSGAVEIQHYDGAVEELGMDDWRQLQVEPIAPPEDWTGPLDRIEPDELGLSDDAMSEQDWSGPLQELRSEPPPPAPSAEEEEGDDEWGEGRLEEELRPID
ncbi:MAG: DUF6763 family protein [Gammaproteobacteria bacterium]